MMCMDDKDNNGTPIDMKLFGRDHNSPHRRIELLLQPCQPIDNDQCINKKDDNEKTIERKMKETIKYMKSPELIIMYNR